jgi:hypothetical protein
MRRGGGVGTIMGQLSGKVAGGDVRGFVTALDKGRTRTGTALTRARR